MRIYKHKDYKHYYNSQVAKNVRKLKNVWITSDEIDIISNHIKENIPKISFGICHGVRNGWEVEAFRKSLGIEVIGTDISPTVNKFSNCIEWDFHKIKEEWKNNIDFIYSNSLDHSYDPEKCLNSWIECLTEVGICYIQWARDSEGKLDSGDCFKATRSEFREFLKKNCKILMEFPEINYTMVFAVGKKV